MIRIYQEGDHVAIGKIFSAAIHQIASEVYTDEQCHAWASKMNDPEHWKRRCQMKHPFVAVSGDSISGFLELDPDGHIDCAYINPEFKRQGVMTALVKHAISVCFDVNIDRLFVEASICAKPMFEKLGFRIIRENVVQIDDVELLNYKMELLRIRENDL